MNGVWKSQLLEDNLPSEEEARAAHMQVEAFLPELGRTICQHQMESFFGVALLHKHFSLKKNEQLLRTSVDDETRHIGPTTRLVGHPYGWRLSGSWKPIAFLDADAHLPIGDVTTSKSFDAAIQAQLIEHGMVNLIGIVTLHDPVYFDDDLILNETTEHASRLSTLRSVCRDASILASSFPTAWRFTADGRPIVIESCC